MRQRNGCTKVKLGNQRSYRFALFGAKIITIKRGALIF